MKRTYWIFGTCVLLALGLMVWGLWPRAEPMAQTPRRYALLLADDRGTAVSQCKQGAQTAVEALGAELIIYSAEQGLPLGEQLLSMLRELEDKDIDGLMLQPCPDEVFEAARALASEQKIPLVYLWAEDARADFCVLSDYAAQGRMLAEAFLGASESQAPYVAAFLQDTAAGQAMLAGLRAALPYPVTVFAAEETGALFAQLAGLPADTVVFALGADASARFARASQHSFAMWGVDPGEDRVRLLEREYLQGIVQDMPYAQGYLAIEAMHGARINGGGMQVIHSPSAIVTKETMYQAENVKTMFPLLQ